MVGQAPTLAFHADLGNARAELTTKQLPWDASERREAAIWEFLDTSNAAGKPFVWTKSADEILAMHGSLNAPWSCITD